MVTLKQNIRMRHGVKTKGVTIKKGQIVTLVEYPTMAGTYYTDYCTVFVKGYGKVRVPKSVIYESVREKVLKKNRMRR